MKKLTSAIALQHMTLQTLDTSRRAIQKRIEELFAEKHELDTLIDDLKAMRALIEETMDEKKAKSAPDRD
jgi:septal ring factor EnvC (AmiA/AmiB activator)